jgi:DegV family protein with EDD domain
MSLFQRLRKILPGRQEPPPPRPVKIVTDSTADLPPDLVRDLDITVVPLQVIFGDTAYRDGIDLSSEEFFRKLAASPEVPRTSQPSIGEFQRVYETLAQQTDRILSIHLSSRLSGTAQTARAAAQSLIGRCTVEVIDSGTVSMALGFAVIAAAQAARAGADLEACAEAAHSTLRRQRLAVALDTLEYLRRGGRIGRAQALLGGLLHIKPVLTIRDGEPHPLARARTRRKALDEVLRVCLDDGARVQEAAVMHTTTPDDARYLADDLRRRCPSVPVIEGRIGPVIGVHGGPGLVGMAVVLAEEATR